MPFNLAGAAGAWAAARQRGVSPKVFADLLSIEPELGSHIDDARAAGHDDETILDHLDGVLPSQPDARAGTMAKLQRLGDLPEAQRSFALFDTRDDYEPLGLSARDVDQLDDALGDREANVGEYDRWGTTDNPLLMEIGNPANPRLRREWAKANGRPWPKDARGRNYDVAHIKAKADGGTDTLDNIRPMHPDDHSLSHIEDFSRWAKRSGIAKTFGGTVLRSGQSPGKIAEPRGPFLARSSLPVSQMQSASHNVFGPNGSVLIPNIANSQAEVIPPSGAGSSRGLGQGAGAARALGILSLVPTITGLLSGRIRIDNLDNFTSDLMGRESQEDRQRWIEGNRKRFCPNSPPGTICI